MNERHTTGGSTTGATAAGSMVIAITFRFIKSTVRNLFKSQKQPKDP